MPTTIKLGDTGEDVKRLQRVFARMKVLGPDDVDGVFGPQTEQVVKDFQQSNGLVVDGVVGPITWKPPTPIPRGITDAPDRIPRAGGGHAPGRA